ncbi:MAG: DegV family protein [Chloroflexi bacterium]|nr:DegV family protein [Chloroflexota bacterium]
MTTRIVTDSTCDLPSELIIRLGIRVLPLYIHVNNHDYLDGIDMTREEFYMRLPSFVDFPRTAVPSPMKLHAMYDELANEGASAILSIHISETLSAAVQVARAAAAETTSVPVTVLDSRQLSLGTGFLVHKAAEMAAAGSSVRDILEVLQDQIKRTQVWAALDTLTYLRRSGRMNSVVSTLGELLQIRPILKMINGVSVAEKTRTHEHAVARLVGALRACAPLERLAFLHSDALAQAQAFQSLVRDLLPSKETWFEEINPVLGAHIGPGAVGFACISKAQ